MDTTTSLALDEMETAARRLRQSAQAGLKPTALEEYLSTVTEAMERLLHGPCSVSARAQYLMLAMRAFELMEAEERKQAGRWEPPPHLTAEETRELLDGAVRIRLLKRIGILDEEDEPLGEEEEPLDEATPTQR